MGSVDHFTPAEIAGLVETKGVTKANAPGVTLFVLGVLAGAFIGLGAVPATTTTLGNVVGGALLVGLVYWVRLSP